MPHVIVFYSESDKLDLPNLLRDFHNAISSDETVKPATVKTWGVPIADCIVSDETKPNAMIHVQVRMKPGRDEERRKKISQELHDIARRHVDERDYECAVSVEIRELDDTTYVSSYSL